MFTEPSCMKGQQENTHQTYMSKHCMNVIRMFSFENNTVPLSCVVVKKGRGEGGYIWTYSIIIIISLGHLCITPILRSHVPYQINILLVVSAIGCVTSTCTNGNNIVPVVN